MKHNFFLLRCAASASLGGLLFGFDTAVIAGATRALSERFDLSPAALGITVSSALWGTIAGALLGGVAGDRWGRRGALKVLAVLYLVSSLGCAFAWDWWSLLFFRFMGGLAIGGSSVIGPTYVAEIAPADRRGRLVAFFQFNVVGGILVAYLSNYLIGHLGLGEMEWRWKLGAPAVPALAFFATLLGIAQSPRWLVQAGRRSEAGDVLRRLGEPDVDGQLNEIAQALAAEQGRQGEKLFTWSHRFPIFLAVSVAVFNQLSGINAILYYLNDIFERSGFSKVSSDTQAVAVGFTLLASTMAAMAVIDRAGRKLLLLIGSIGTAVCLACVAWVFEARAHENLLVWLLAAYIAFFGFSSGAVIWVYISEVFPNRVRAKGQSLGSFTHWFMDALVSGIYPVAVVWSVAAPFAFFAAMMVVQFFVVLLVFPETKGISLEQMQHRLGIGAQRSADADSSFV